MLCTQSAAHLGLLGVSQRERAHPFDEATCNNASPVLLLPAIWMKTKPTAQLGCGTVLEPLLARQPQRQGHRFGKSHTLPSYRGIPSKQLCSFSQGLHRMVPPACGPGLPGSSCCRPGLRHESIHGEPMIRPCAPYPVLQDAGRALDMSSPRQPHIWNTPADWTDRLFKHGHCILIQGFSPFPEASFL